MCRWNLSCSSIITPRSLTWSTTGSAELPIAKLGSAPVILLPIWICITAHFLTEILNCHSLHHFSTRFNLSLKLTPSSLMSRVAHILASSANSLHTQLPSLKMSMISLINNTNSKGPITLPCTIPLQRYNRHDKQLPTRVCWVRQFKKLLILFNRLPLIP